MEPVKAPGESAPRPKPPPAHIVMKGVQPYTIMYLHEPGCSIQIYDSDLRCHFRFEDLIQAHILHISSLCVPPAFVGVVLLDESKLQVTYGGNRRRGIISNAWLAAGVQQIRRTIFTPCPPYILMSLISHLETISRIDYAPRDRDKALRKLRVSLSDLL